MNKKMKLAGKVLAIGAAAVFALAPAVSTATSSKLEHCMGVNACKGKGSCKMANNSCKSQNACKGQGFVALTKTQCEQVGGKME